MKKFAISMLVGVSLSACSYNNAEFNHVGGGNAYLLDNVMEKAETKAMVLYRMTALAMFFGFAAERGVTEPLEAVVYKNLAQDFAQRLQKAYKIAYSECTIDKTETCNIPQQMFEMTLPDLESTLLKLAVISLNRSEFDKIYQNLISQNYIGAATALLKSFDEIYGIYHRGAAVRRVDKEIMWQMQTKNAYDDKPTFDNSVANDKTNATIAAQNYDAFVKSPSPPLRPSWNYFQPLLIKFQDSCSKIYRRDQGESCNFKEYTETPDFRKAINW